MKKFLILLLALVLCVSAFAACGGQPDGPANDTEQALKNATAYVKNMYKNLLTENKTATDFDLIDSVKVAGVDYAVEWTVNTEAVKVVAGEGKVTIDIDEKSSADLAYELTAVVTAADGTKGTPLTFKLLVPSANFMTIPQALAAADGELVTVSGTVTLINTPWDDGYKNISVTIEDEAGNQLYLYRIATNVTIGDVITVKGTMATYNNARQIAAGATAEITGHVEVTQTYTEMTIPQAIAADDNTLVIVKGTVKTIDGAWSDSYGNMSVTIVDDAGNELYIYRLATKVEQGDILTIKGIVGSYNGAKQIAQGATAEITGHKDLALEYKTVTIAEAIAAEDNTLVTVKGIVKTINTEWSDSYNNITVTITDGNGNELYIYRLATKVAVGDAVTIQGKVSSYNGAKQIAAGATAEITGSYKNATIPEAIAAEDNTLVIVKGTVKTINGAWSEQYGNMNVTIVDEAGNELYLYRLATKVAEGDALTVYGKVGSYNGAKQIAQGATAEIAKATEGGETSGNAPEGSVTVTKTMDELATANAWESGTQYKEIAIALDDVVSVTFNGGNNSGKYYTNDQGNQIRVYATDTPAGTITISATGKTIVSVKITTVEGTYAFLQLDGDTTEDYSNKVVTVNAGSVTFNTVKNGSDGKQVRILAIEVVYA